MRGRVPHLGLQSMLESVVVSLRSLSELVLDAPEPLALVLFGLGMILVSKNVRPRVKRRLARPPRPVERAHEEPLGKTAAA